MRRLGSLIAAIALTVLLAGSVSASPRSTFTGSFDVLYQGNVVGHITASIWSTDLTSPAGFYSFRTPDGTYSTAQIGEAAFYRDGPHKQVWFQGMEIFYLGGTHNSYNVFVGHFVDDGPGTRYVEFFGQNIQGEGAENFYLDPGTGTSYHGLFDVGPGTFSLRVAP
jgi:hypothetical protein